MTSRSAFDECRWVSPAAGVFVGVWTGFRGGKARHAVPTSMDPSSTRKSYRHLSVDSHIAAALEPDGVA